MLALQAGCGRSSTPEFAANEVEWLKQEKINLGNESSFAIGLRNEVKQMMTNMFGTPDHARIPEAINHRGTKDREILALSNLRLAAGPVASNREGEAQGLFREHCAHCHGVTGNGRGPGSTVLTPYPRDFRLGKFKFKSTPQRYPPSDDDLHRILQEGIPGTAMPSFKLLPAEELDALVDYVKYLSLRGQVERHLLYEVGQLANDSFFEQSETAEQILGDGTFNQEITDELGQRLSSAEYSEGSVWNYLRSNFEDSIQDSFIPYFRDRWLDVNKSKIVLPVTPSWFEQRGPKREQHVQEGRALFLGKATCYQCHGKDGSGIGELAGYDDWTDDWVKSPGVDVNNKSTIESFLRAGAHPPVLARPRNLRQGVFRGGDAPQDIYLRIANGIEGSPMPAATSLSEDEIWSLVAFVLEVPRQADLLANENMDSRPGAPQ